MNDTNFPMQPGDGATSFLPVDMPPDIVPLRHPTFAPDISGSFTDGIADAIAAHSAAA